KKHYGHASRAFLRRFVEKFDAENKDISDAISSFVSMACPAGSDGQVFRVARRFALVAAAGEKAIAWGILPWPPGTATKSAERLFAGWLAQRGALGSHEVHSAISQVRHIIERYGASRFFSVKGGGTVIPDRLGYFKGDGEDRIYLVQPEAFRAE